MNAPDLSEYLTTEEAAEALRVDRSTLARWVRSGRATPDLVLPGRYNPAYMWTPETVAGLRPPEAEPP